MASPGEGTGAAMTGPQFTVTEETGQPSFTGLRHLLKVCLWLVSILYIPTVQVLERGEFMELAYHVSRGDQLIVRGSHVTTVTSILAILKVYNYHYYQSL